MCEECLSFKDVPFFQGAKQAILQHYQNQKSPERGNVLSPTEDPTERQLVVFRKGAA